MGKNARRKRELRRRQARPPGDPTEERALSSIAASVLWDPPPGSLACKQCGHERTLVDMEANPGPCPECGCLTMVGPAHGFGSMAGP